jgi:hypothetical protein
MRRPLFQGSRRGTDDCLLSGMIVSSDPTTPSRLRPGNARPCILSPMAGSRRKPARGSLAVKRSRHSDRAPPCGRPQWVVMCHFKPLGRCRAQPGQEPEAIQFGAARHPSVMPGEGWSQEPSALRSTMTGQPDCVRFDPLLPSPRSAMLSPPPTRRSTGTVTLCSRFPEMTKR